ncbi:hypothetical protein COLO4_38315 [Corchorus olitorius]|uniref:DUF4283 domain-containing protein n=1 Tax=Corchorus olitorius TaxID=93759 RepID=A0A1R3FVJ2_9ROSI|nr:hypothetical protein COLO4_38315 [Corchorus olitorius]
MEEMVIDLGLVGNESCGVDDWVAVGKLIVDRNLNRAGVMAILRNIWPEKEAPAIGEVGLNTYSISFVSKELMMKALEENPWSIMGHCLNLKRWEANTPMALLDFKGIQFWIQIHNLPRELLTKQNGEKIGHSLGEVIEVEEPRGRFGLNRGFLPMRIIVDSERPLVPGFWFPSGDGDKRWADIKYEKLPDFCFDCGRLRHGCKHCKFESQGNGSERKFGPHLRANSLRKLEYGDELKNPKESQAELWRKGKGVSRTVAREGWVAGTRELQTLPARGEGCAREMCDVGKSCAENSGKGIEDSMPKSSGAADRMSQQQNTEKEKSPIKKVLGSWISKPAAILGLTSPKRNMVQSPVQSPEKGIMELPGQVYIEPEQRGSPLKENDGTLVFSPTKVLRTVLNLSSVFRRMNLKRKSSLCPKCL